MPGQHTQSCFAVERAAQREKPVKTWQVRTISLSTSACPGHCSQPEQDADSPMLTVPTFQLCGPGEVTRPEGLPMVLWGLSDPLCGRLGRTQSVHDCGNHDSYPRNRQARGGWLEACSLFTPLVSSFPQCSHLFHKQDHFPPDALIRSLRLEC